MFDIQCFIASIFFEEPHSVLNRKILVYLLRLRTGPEILLNRDLTTDNDFFFLCGDNNRVMLVSWFASVSIIMFHNSEFISVNGKELFTQTSPYLSANEKGGKIESCGYWF